MNLKVYVSTVIQSRTIVNKAKQKPVARRKKKAPVTPWPPPPFKPLTKEDLEDIHRRRFQDNRGEPHGMVGTARR